MVSKIFSTLALAATLVSAQTHSDCDPTKGDVCPDEPALGGSIDIDFTQGPNDWFTVATGTTLTYDKDKGAVFTIASVTDAPTIMATEYMMFGEVEVTLQVAPGAGIVTSFVMQSADLDEIDLEWIGSDPDHTQTNYFGKGCTGVYDRGGMHVMSDLGAPNPITTEVTYKVVWTESQLEWFVNGKSMRVLSAASATGCNSYPQTPMQIRLGTWVAGQPSAQPGTITWAGGLADFSKGPFIGYYKSLKITDYAKGVTGATAYKYTDKTGSADSIQVLTGDKPSTNSTSSSSTTATATTLSSVPVATNTPSSNSSTTPTTGTSGTGTGTGSGSGTSSTPSNTIAPGAAGRFSITLGQAVLTAAVVLGSFVL